MTPERYLEITRLCQAALELNASQRAAFLSQACAGDDDLRGEIEALLAADAQANSLIDKPALEVAAKLFAREQRSLAGERLGNYQVLSRLGAGGMGEVYLAEDTRLKRKVALKLLPAAFTQDSERVSRFEQEAQAASALNHPNILTIYDFGQTATGQGSLHYLATEFVEGQTLRQLLQSGPLPVSPVIEIGVQLADALAAAHQAGIIHRDIKPENIMRRPDGYVKLLDFGLAKLTEKAHSPALTDPGKVMGTVSYMSPEQALGQPLDARTDLFSLGVVLYELLTGAHPFTGASEAAVYDALLRQPPASLRQSQPHLSAELEWILKRALEKERELRYQTAADLKAALLALKRNSDANTIAVNTSSAQPRAPRTTKKFGLLKIAAALVVLMGLGVAGRWWQRGKLEVRSTATRPPISFTRLTAQAGQELYPSLSPDGKQLLFVGDESGNRDIWLQRVGGATALNLTRDCIAEDTQPAFSPDGEQIAFRSERDGGGIFLMGATGENLRRLTHQGFNPAWSPAGNEIVYATGYFTDVPNNRSAPPSALHVLNVQTGTTRQLIEGDAVQPNWSPHGQRIAYWGIHRGGQRDIWTVPAAGGVPVQVTNDGSVNWNPVWSPDGRYLYFASDRGGSMNLWRVPLDEPTGQVQDAPEPVTTPATYSGFISFARDGRHLVYVESNYQVNLQEVAFDPVKLRVGGTPQWITRGARIATQQHVSPDQQWLVFDSLGNRQEDLFIVRRDGSGLRQLTNDPFKERAPRWSPDGRHILFFTDRTGRYELWQINADGSDAKQLTFTTGSQIQMPQWSPDGRTILCSLQNQPPFLMDPAIPWAQQTPQALPAKGFPENFLVSSWSADGRKLIGYRNGIFTYTFATQQYERLADAGYLPIWLNDNRHALFIATDKLNLLDTQTRQIIEVLSVAPRLLKFISVSKDNRFISLSVDTSEADIWLAALTETPAPK
ncbi:MAG: serine/threonine-protein kinase [Acidobacteria bacterium]|nr:serine/threonine-protein kinase [Acidobacteriota bacterium]MBI3422724.1 serine/threonine-protein kinase [Acidobacteriota bacterium]